MDVKGSPAKIQTQTRCNLIGCSMTAQPPVLSPNSVIPSPSPDYAFIPTKIISVRISKIVLFCFLMFLK
jgi:hypothetical protein